MQAQVFATDIRSRAGALVGADTEVAGNLTASAAGIGNTPFSEKPTYKPESNGTIQLAGFGAKQDPQLPPPPRPGRYGHRGTAHQKSGFPPGRRRSASRRVP
jgi:hypothetical protein